MRVPRSEKGQGLPLVIAIVIGVLIVVVIFVLNYNQLFTQTEVAQSAIDASALEAAKELSKVTTANTAFGRVGVVDQYPAEDPSLGEDQEKPTVAKEPVYGINTIVGRARLDMIIANQLGNINMVALAKKDADDAQKAVVELNKALIEAAEKSGKYQDRDGENAQLNLKQTAADAYNRTEFKTSGRSDKASADEFQIALGTVNQPGFITNIPAPKEETQTDKTAEFTDASGAKRRFYLPGLEITDGSGAKYIFSCIADAARLVDRQAFVRAADANKTGPSVALSVVQVTYRERFRGAQGQLVQQLEVAAAACGGKRITPTASIFRLEFPQGVPQKDSGGVSFATLKSLLNSSSGGWTGRGRYFTSNNGPFPGPQPATVVSLPRQAGDPASFFDRSKDFPHVTLAHYLYDWIRNDGLRPSPSAIKKLVDNTVLRGASVGEERILTSFGDFLIQPAIAQGIPGSSGGTLDCGVFGGIFDMEPNSDTAMDNPTKDPRSLMELVFQPGNPTVRNNHWDQGMVFRMQASIPQQMSFAPPTTMAHGMDANNNPTTTDGNPISHLLDYRQALIDQILTSVDVAVVAVQVGVEQAQRMQELQAQLDPIIDQLNDLAAAMAALGTGQQAQYNALLAQYNSIKANQYDPLKAQFDVAKQKHSRALAAYANALRAVNLSAGSLGNLLAITSLGCQDVHDPTQNPGKGGQPNASLDNMHFRVARTEHFWPPKKGRIPTKTEIENGSAPTAQDPDSAGDKNWCGRPFFLNNLAGLQNPCTLQVIPVGQIRNFKFVTIGDASTDPADKTGVLRSVTANLVENIKPIAPPVPGQTWNNGGDFVNQTGVSALLRGQNQHQTLNVYKEQSDQDPRLFIVWSTMAQDNVRNHTAGALGGADARNPLTPGNALECGRFNRQHPEITEARKRACDVEACRFQVTSPNLYTDIKIPPYEFPPPPPQAPELPPLNPVPPPPPPPPSHH